MNQRFIIGQTVYDESIIEEMRYYADSPLESFLFPRGCNNTTISLDEFIKEFKKFQILIRDQLDVNNPDKMREFLVKFLNEMRGTYIHTYGYLTDIGHPSSRNNLTNKRR